MLTNFLQNIGLSDNEARVYLSAYKLVAAPVSLIAKHAQLNRTTTYGNVKTLTKKGLLKTQKSGKTEYFSAVEPKFFQRYLEDRKHGLLEAESKLRELLPAFDKLRDPSTNLNDVRFYQGIEGIKQMYNHVLATGKPIHSFLPAHQIPKKLWKYLKSEFAPKKRQKSIQSFVLSPHTARSIELKKSDASNLRETYLIPYDSIPFDSEITISGDIIAMVSFENSTIFGTLIQSPLAANTLRTIFELCKKSSIDV